ncbi:hypothetical protein HHK36_010767 [Tetracentron sinense]|uniref:NAD(P)H dehydrogenase (quinone) n=1 Tax=Tetracentron sinense TaxID=13715 RepID=A0A835DFL0_TETSI|nr:hypothetical protein HHK36_010767 [Tetracentron sinense]
MLLASVLAYRCLVKEDDRDASSSLFESVEPCSGVANVGRYSVVGAQPTMEIVAQENMVTIRKGIGPRMRYVEKKKLPFSSAPEDDRNLGDIHLGLYEDVIVFDHVEKKAYVIHWVQLERYFFVERAYNDGMKWKACIQLLESASSIELAREDMKMRDIITGFYYSLYGHVGIMAREVQRGANTVQSVEATLWQVPETLPERILEKMKAPPKAEEVAEIRPEQLTEADGFIFGFPSRFGMMAAQFKAFFDATHEIWASQALAGKPAGIFWSTGFHGGGQENTALTAITQLAHHGMIFVPLGYTFGDSMFQMNEVKGGSSYGAGTYAGDGSREPTELELQQAFYQGKYTAEIAKKLKDQPPV